MRFEDHSGASYSPSPSGSEGWDEGTNIESLRGNQRTLQQPYFPTRSSLVWYNVDTVQPAKLKQKQSLSFRTSTQTLVKQKLLMRVVSGD
jgi:hypothetical protein